MKHVYSLLLLLLCSFFSLQSNANEVTVKGYVKFANGAYAPNISVKIAVLSPCEVEHTVTTNQNGFYADKVACDGMITKVRVSILCNGQVISVIKEVSTTNVVEANLTLCYSSVACVARFTATQLEPRDNHPFAVKFNSSESETSGDDKIIHRIWDFGDGTVMNEGTVDPVHDYEKPGEYKVCLTIKTDRGCTNTKCMVIQVKSRCHADFRFETTNAGVKFNSNISTAADGDSIIGRAWNFGDGTVIDGTVAPVHDYEKPGEYKVCLTIKTAKGCTDTKCMIVQVKSRCHADFRFENTSAGVKFNSNISTVSDGDSIIGRAWNFGDGSAILKGPIDPLHKFPHAGTYNVCLVIWTKNGCENRICKQVTVPQSTPECRARFVFERVAPQKFRFSSRPSIVAPGDEIVERQWNFHDGTDVVTTNDVSILHEFEKPGMYEVCLKIKTAKGCESRFCTVVRVEEKQHEGSVKIICLYPQPVHNQLNVQIFSRVDHIPAKISIVDIYGQVKWTKDVWLEQGINPFEVPTQWLLTGPYFFRVVCRVWGPSQLFLKI